MLDEELVRVTINGRLCYIASGSYESISSEAGGKGTSPINYYGPTHRGVLVRGTAVSLESGMVFIVPDAPGWRMSREGMDDGRVVEGIG